MQAYSCPSPVFAGPLWTTENNCIYPSHAQEPKYCAFRVLLSQPLVFPHSETLWHSVRRADSTEVSSILHPPEKLKLHRRTQTYVVSLPNRDLYVDLHTLHKRTFYRKERYFASYTYCPNVPSSLSRCAGSVPHIPLGILRATFDPVGSSAAAELRPHTLMPRTVMAWDCVQTGIAHGGCICI